MPEIPNATSSLPASSSFSGPSVSLEPLQNHHQGGVGISRGAGPKRNIYAFPRGGIPARNFQLPGFALKMGEVGKKQLPLGLLDSSLSTMKACSNGIRKNYSSSIKLSSPQFQKGLIGGVSAACSNAVMHAPGSMIYRARKNFTFPKASDMTFRGLQVSTVKVFLKWFMLDFSKIGFEKIIHSMREGSLIYWSSSLDKAIASIIASLAVCYGICPIEQVIQRQVHFKESIFKALQQVITEGPSGLFQGSHISVFTTVVNYVADSLGDQIGETAEKKAQISKAIRFFLAPFLFVLHVVKNLQQADGVGLIQGFKLFDLACKNQRAEVVGHLILNALFFGYVCQYVHRFFKDSLEVKMSNVLSENMKVNEQENRPSHQQINSSVLNGKK